MQRKLRRATPTDAAELAALHLESRRVAMPWLAVLHDLDDVTAYLREHVLPRCAVQVCEEHGRLVGYGAVDVAAGELEHLYLASDARRRGIGTRLLDVAKAESPAGLALWVFQRNLAARAFYEAHGFALVELTDGAGNEEREPDARYRWAGGSTSGT